MSEDGDDICCVVCGQTERPEKGWIYKTSEIEPVRIDHDELRFKPHEDASAYCSTSCSQQDRPADSYDERDND